MPLDLLALDDKKSALRQTIHEQGTINLRDMDIPSLYIGDEARRLRICSNSPTDLQISEFLSPVIRDVQQSGYQSNLYTALYEAVLNAHQHGNKYDPDKDIVLAYDLSPKAAEFTVADQGGLVRSDYLPYILFCRDPNRRKFQDFYQFSGIERNSTNLGVGTFTIHSYFDEVGFYKSSEGGLAVSMRKHK